MSTGLLILVNALWAVTLWLSLPWVLRLLLGSRVAGLQLAVTRAVLLGLPVIGWLACAGAARGDPWLRIEPELTPVATVTRETPAATPAMPAADSRALREERVTERTPHTGRPLLVPASHEPMPSPAPRVLDLEAPPAEPTEWTPPAPATDTSPAVEPPPALDFAATPALESTVATATPTPIPTATPTPQTAPPPVLPLALAALYAIGVVLALARHGALHLALWRLRRNWRAVTGPTAAWFASLAGPRWPLLVAPELGGAAATGILRPAVVVPVAWLEQLDRGRLEPLLQHELAHLRAHDPLFKTLWALTRAVLWPHPLVHWLAGRDALLSELVADGRVLERGHGRRDYARLLAQLIEDPPSPRPVAITTGILGTRGALEGRIRMILDPRLNRPAVRWSAVLLASIPVAFMGWLLAHPLVGEPDESGATLVLEGAVDDSATATGEVPVKFENIDGYWHAVRVGPDDKKVWQLRLCPVGRGWPKVTDLVPQLVEGEVLEQAYVQIVDEDSEKTLLFVIDLENGYVDEMQDMKRAKVRDHLLVADESGAMHVLAAEDLRRSIAAQHEAAGDYELALRTLQNSQRAAELRAHESEVAAAAVDLEHCEAELTRLCELCKNGVVAREEVNAARARVAEAKAVLQRRKANLERARLNSEVTRNENHHARAVRQYHAGNTQATARHVQELQQAMAPFVAACQQLTDRVTALERRIEGMNVHESVRAAERAAAEIHRATTYDSADARRTHDAAAAAARERAMQAILEKRHRDTEGHALEVWLAETKSSNESLKAALERKDERIHTLEAEIQELRAALDELRAAEGRRRPGGVR